MTPRALRTAVAHGELVRVLPNRYAPAAHAESTVVRAHAACMSTRGVLTGNTALAAWGVATSEDHEVLVSAAPGTRPPHAAWLRAIRNGPAHAAAWWRGVPVASPDIAAVDAYATARDPSIEPLLAVLRAGLATPDDVARVIGVRTQMQGRAQAFEAVDAFRRGLHSFLEIAADRRVFTGPVFAQMVRQHRVRAGGRLYRIDAYEPESMTAFETDGTAFHGSAEARLRDSRRDAELAALGILTVRFPYPDVMSRPEWCNTIARRVIERRLRGSGSATGAIC